MGTLVSGLLVLPTFLDQLKAMMVNAGNWPDDIVVGAVVAVRGQELLCNLNPNPHRDEMLQCLREFVLGLHEADGSGDDAPASRAGMALFPLPNGSRWESFKLG